MKFLQSRGGLEEGGDRLRGAKTGGDSREGCVLEALHLYCAGISLTVQELPALCVHVTIVVIAEVRCHCYRIMHVKS